ncbi:hypothetical protein AgCh_005847 [Apium graveolens]
MNRLILTFTHLSFSSWGLWSLYAYRKAPKVTRRGSPFSSETRKNLEVVAQGANLTLDCNLFEEDCTALSIQQLHRICTFIHSDKEDGTACVSPEVIASMNEVMTMKDSEETDTTDLNSYLLDDLSSIPVSIEEISDLMKQLGAGQMSVPNLLTSMVVRHAILCVDK